MADYDIKWIKGFQFFDSSGDPLNGGLLRIYDAGTTTARTVYKDSAAGTAWTQPITLDSAGRLTASIYVPTGTWKYALTTAADTGFLTPIVTEDDLAGAVAAVSLTTARPETPILTKAIDYTIVAADIGKLVQTDATGGDITITLISAVTAGSGANVWVQQTSSAGKTTVVPAGAQTINGVSLITINRRYGIVKFISDGANWTASDVLADELTVASAATCNILAAASDQIAISGTTTITSLGTGVNKLKFVRFSGALTLTHNATSLILPGAANITTTAGDTCIVVSDASSNARVFGYQRVSGASVAAPLVPPTGRLTLTTATPILTSSVTAATTYYYTPYNGNTIMLYDGADWRAYNYSELSQTTADTTKAPAATALDNNYDLFIGLSSGVPALFRGPAWTSSTARGTGAGTTELVRVSGVWMNANAITNGPAAQRGVYVGSIRTNGSNQVDMMVGAPAAAAGGTANQLYVWNMYNRVDVAATCRDSTDNWAYSTATWRSANGNNANRISVLRGLDEEAATVLHTAYSANSTSGARYSSIGLDATNAPATGAQTAFFDGDSDIAGLIATMQSSWSGLAGIGLHFFQAIEYSEATGVTTWYGDDGAALIQMTLALVARM